LRTTVDLDPEILSAARQLAAARSISLGKALSELARRGLARWDRKPGRPAQSLSSRSFESRLPMAACQYQHADWRARHPEGATRDSTTYCLSHDLLPLLWLRLGYAINALLDLDRA
jgi:hypothetical protein